MSTSAHHNARRAGVVVAGVTAAAALATGVAEAASAAGAPVPRITTTGTIYACYSNTTKALFQTTKSVGCKTGFTELSWNAKGPQGPPGPQGAKGAPGPAGAIAAYFHYGSTFTSLVAGVPTVVATIVPDSAGEFVANAQATMAGNGGAFCWMQDVSPGGGVFSPTPLAKNIQKGTPRAFTVPTTGAFFATSRSPIEELCQHTTSTSKSVVGFSDTAITVTRVSTAQQQAPAARPRHRFTKPAPPARPVPRSQSGR